MKSGSERRHTPSQESQTTGLGGCKRNGLWVFRKCHFQPFSPVFSNCYLPETLDPCFDRRLALTVAHLGQAPLAAARPPALGSEDVEYQPLG